MVRVPRWADKSQARAVVNKKEAAPLWLGNYLIFETTGRGDTVTITFPMVEQTVKLGYPFDKTYACTFKGNTLVDIAPRDTNLAGYPIYLRDNYKTGTQAPMKKVTRHVAPLLIEW